jgi:hypothetical protein
MHGNVTRAERRNELTNPKSRRRRVPALRECCDF